MWVGFTTSTKKGTVMSASLCLLTIQRTAIVAEMIVKSLYRTRNLIREVRSYVQQK